MDYIYSTLQPKFISPYNTKPNRISLRKKVPGNTKADYPNIFGLSPKTTESNENKFNDFYKEFFSKDAISLPKLIINESIDVLQNRNCTFTDPRYPKNFKNNISKCEKQKSRLKIIESLDDPDKMKFFHESHYDSLLNEKNSNSNHQPLIDILVPKISSIDFNNQSHMKIHQYSLSTSDITLKLKGLCLVIRDPTSKKKDLNKIRLPFSLIPFYYSISHHLFLYFLAQIIKMPLTSKDSLDFVSSISLDFNSLKNYVTDIISEDKLFSPESILINNERYNESQRSIKYSWLIQNKELELEIQPLMIELKAKLTPQSPSKATGTEKKKKLIIRKAISKTLMCFFIKTAYANWEKPALCYLSSFKLFRKVISYAYGRPMPANESMVLLDEQNDSINSKAVSQHQMKSPNAFSKNSRHNNNPNQDTIIEEHFSHSKSLFSFFMTLKESNYFFTFYSYKVSLQIESFQSNHFAFDISFEKMKFLYQFKSKHNINDIIRKCIIVNKSNETVSCSIELLKGIAFESMEKFFESKDELNCLKSTLSVSLPRIEWEEIVNVYGTRMKEMKGHKYFPNDDIVERLLNVDKNKWPDIFSDFQEELCQEIEKKANRALHHTKTVRT